MDERCVQIRPGAHIFVAHRDGGGVHRFKHSDTVIIIIIFSFVGAKGRLVLLGFLALLGFLLGVWWDAT